MIPNQRSLFSIPPDVAYLNASYLGPQLRAASDAGIRGLRRKEQPWGIVADDFFDTGERVRRLFADLVGVDAAGVAHIPAASFGLSVAAANLPVRQGQTVVVVEEQYPSNIYPWWRVAGAAGADLITVPRAPGKAWSDGVLDAIDARTAVVALPHCHWTDGVLLDLVTIAGAARGAGAAVVVDASQSLGAHPLDLPGVDPDFLVTVGYKWLLGPYRTAFLWVAPRWRDGIPIEHGWMGRSGSRDFARVAEYTDEFEPGARRYDGGEFGDFIAMPMLEASLAQLVEWSVPEISDSLSALTRSVEEAADELGLAPSRMPERAPHMIGIRFPGGQPQGLLERLGREKIHLSVRGSSMRVSPHLHNTPEDVDRLVEVLADLV